MHPIPHLAPFLLGLSTALIASSAVLLRRRIQHNPWYGVRTPTILGGTEATWYAINRRRALAFLSIGLLLLPAAYTIGLIQL